MNILNDDKIINQSQGQESQDVRHVKILGSTKLYVAFAVGIVSLFLSLFIFFCLPFISFGATGTLGSEEPYVYCEYFTEDGEQVDGNSLSADTSYVVDIYVSNINNISVIEVTASYDTDVVTVSDTPSALMSDTVTDMESMGYLLGDGNIVFGFVSTDDATTAVSDSGENVLISEVSMTFSLDCDAADYVTISSNPNLTFVEADYGDGYDDSYAIDVDYEDYDGNLYLMTADVTPAFDSEDTYSVSGSIVIMTDSSGSTSGIAVSGDYYINVYSSSDCSEDSFVTSADCSESYDDDGIKLTTFVIAGLENGTYYATISSEYAITRSITIVVDNSDIESVIIPMVVCDYNCDGYITATDLATVYSNYGSSTDYCDLNGDGYITATDLAVVYSCYGVSDYDAITIPNN